MSWTYIYYILLIALTFDFIDAAYPPDGFKDFCLIAIEAIGNAGLWRYDPKEEMIHGIPTMYLMKRHIFKTTDKRRVYEDRDVIKNAKLAWSRTWWWFSNYAFRFSLQMSRLDYGVPHPCSFDRRSPKFYRVLRDFFGARHIGWAQVINEIVNVECVPQNGSLSSQLGYILPQYDMSSVYSCATWLKEIEVSSGVPSKATALEVDFRAGKCTIHYEGHRALRASSYGDKEYCFLKKTFDIPRFPGFYKGCKVYVEDRVFAGLWDMELSSLTPILRHRNTTMDDPSSVMINLHKGYDDNVTLQENGLLKFFKANKLRLTIPIPWHLCIGPDTGYFQTFDASSSQIGSIYRHDRGLDCVPFYGFSISLNKQFLGFRKYRMNDDYSILSCGEYVKQAFPFGDWKVIISTIRDGPCWAYGGGVDYSEMRLVNRRNTYSCFSSKYFKNYQPAPHCQYMVEASYYSGFYKPVLNWEDNYSQFPKLVRGPFGTYTVDSEVMVWEEGYKIFDVDDRDDIFIVDWGKGNICPEEEGSAKIPILQNGHILGFMYRYDNNKLCSAWPVILEPRNLDSGEFYKFTNIETLKDCLDKYKELHGDNDNWSSVVRKSSDCTVYCEDLSLFEMNTWDSELDEDGKSTDYSCYKLGLEGLPLTEGWQPAS